MSSETCEVFQSSASGKEEGIPARRAWAQLNPMSLGLFGIELLASGIPPFVLSRVRTQALRLAGVQIGHASAFWGHPILVGTGDISGRLKVGSHCGFNAGCFFELEQSVTIGDHVSVGHRVMFLTQSHVKLDASSNSIEICDGAWLGARCTIMPGVTVGAGTVVAAGVIVRESLPEDVLFTGTRKIPIGRWRTKR